MNTAYLFPGQGSQHVGMGMELYENIPASRAVFDQADVQLGFSISEICFRGPEESLTDTVNQQPALFVTSLAAFEAIRLQGEWPAPDYFAGHSLGEISALVATGSISFREGLALVRRRGELMKQAGEKEPGAMAAILGLHFDQVAMLCDQAQNATGRAVQVANDNCPGQVVVSGDSEALSEVMRLAQEGGARKVVPLPISIAAHSSLMTSAADHFAKEIDATNIAKPTKPVIGNVSAQPMTTPAEIKSDLRAQLTSPVRWTESVGYMLDQGVESFYEVGPGSVLLGLVKRIDRKAKRFQFDLNP